MAMPDYNLNDHIGWTTTRGLPLCSQAVYHIVNLVHVTYTSFIPRFAGINEQNACCYVSVLTQISNNEQFFNEAQTIIIPHNLLNLIEFDYLLNNTLLDIAQITLLLNAVELTLEFEGFLNQLQGINPTNNQDFQYRDVISSGLMYCPQFLRDAETFLLNT